MVSVSRAVCRMVLASSLALGMVAGIAGCSGAQAAPESTFVLLNGNKQSTADMKGKVTLVNFWATSCVTCVAEMPFKVAIDNTGAVAKAWGDVQLRPTIYIVDKRGRIVKSYVGEPDFADLNRLIERLLEQKA